ncbi:hypothetical protein EON82_07690 [bacterium]|nr:MAG: hypothetical protein EON82_07690 [bacterium]
MLWLFLLSLAVGAAVGYRLVTRKPKAKYFLHLEYWVYLSSETMPPQDEVMTRLVRPEVGRSAITGAEAALFSDVRLHIALILRRKNGCLFRPDLLAPYVDATPDQLEILQSAQSLVRVRYISEEKVSDTRYLKFLPQVARAYAEMGDSKLIYDPVGERLLDPQELKGGDSGPTLRWVAEATGGHVETLDLKKRGLSEIKTAWVAADERWIVGEVMDQVAREAWSQGELPQVAMAQAFEDCFQVTLEADRQGTTTARIHRIQETA